MFYLYLRFSHSPPGITFPPESGSCCSGLHFKANETASSKAFSPILKDWRRSPWILSRSFWADELGVTNRDKGESKENKFCNKHENQNQYMFCNKLEKNNTCDPGRREAFVVFLTTVVVRSNLGTFLLPDWNAQKSRPQLVENPRRNFHLNGLRLEGSVQKHIFDVDLFIFIWRLLDLVRRIRIFTWKRRKRKMTKKRRMMREPPSFYLWPSLPFWEAFLKKEHI